MSAPNVLKGEVVSTMNEKAIVFALANPDPEILPDVALKHGAEIVATGRSDFPNQINNSLVFPGIFRGLIDSKSAEINMEIKKLAAISLAKTIPDG